jgi:hypothetical protein
LRKISQSSANSAQAKCAAGWLQSMKDAQEVSMDRSRLLWNTDSAGLPRASVLVMVLCAAMVAGIAPVNAQQRDGAQRDSAEQLRLNAPIGHRQPRPSDLPPRVREDENHPPNSENGFDMTPQGKICRAC